MKLNSKIISVLVLTVAMAAVLVLYMNNAAQNKADQPASSSAASSTVEDTSDAVYTIKNATGQKVTGLYLYAVGTAQGENHAADGMAADASVTIVTPYSPEAKAGTYVLEFVTEDGAVQKFETLYYEVASIDLLSVDAAAGATPIVFGY